MRASIVPLCAGILTMVVLACSSNPPESSGNDSVPGPLGSGPAADIPPAVMAGSGGAGGASAGVDSAGGSAAAAGSLGDMSPVATQGGAGGALNQQEASAGAAGEVTSAGDVSDDNPGSDAGGAGSIAPLEPETVEPDAVPEVEPEEGMAEPEAMPEPIEAAWHGAIPTGLSAATLAADYASWKNSYIEECSQQGSAVVVKDGGHVVSEGIAYGMLLSVNLDDQDLFDKLWRFYLDHVNENGLMDWSWEVCGAPGSNDSGAASDAELDAAMALLQAQARWGGEYAMAAEALAAKILEHETEECSGRRVLLPGDSWGGCNDSSGETRINPSYFAPGYYRVFAQQFPSQASAWEALLAGTYELYPQYQMRMDGLFPDWSDSDGADWYGSAYYYDACRTPWRIATDFAWFGEEQAQASLLLVQNAIDRAGGIPVAGYDNNSAFSGAFALANITDQDRMDAAYSQWMSAGGDDAPYFQSTLRLIYLLLAAGEFPSSL